MIFSLNLFVGWNMYASQALISSEHALNWISSVDDFINDSVDQWEVQVLAEVKDDLSFFAVVHKLAMRGYQYHLYDLLLCLNYNGYYEKNSSSKWCSFH